MKLADNIHVKIPKQLYVGVQGKKSFDIENPPLAFATPYGDGVKDFASRRKTVDSWAGYNTPTIEYLYDADGTPIRSEPYGAHAYKKVYPEIVEQGFTIDNDFQEGFYFDKVISRWQTNNKFYRINDPRGFQLEIDSDNLGDILLNAHISKGYLVGKFCWARYNGKAYLVRENHPSILRETQPVVKRENKTVKIGDEVYFTLSPTEHYVFCGKFYILKFTQRSRFKNVTTGEIHSNASRIQLRYGWQSTPEQRALVQAQREEQERAYYGVNKPISQNIYRKDLKPFYLYKRTNGKHPYANEYYILRGPGTFEFVSEGNEFELPKFGDEPFKFDSYEYGLNRGILFETKKDILNFEVTPEFLTERNKKLFPWKLPADSYSRSYPHLTIEPTYQDAIEILPGQSVY